MSSPSENQLPV